MALGGLPVAVAVAALVLGLLVLPASGHTLTDRCPHRGAAAECGVAPRSVGGEDPGPVARLYGSEVRRIPTSSPLVALTFNAAWDETGVETALTVLRGRNVPATFFLTGRFAERHPGAARLMAAEHGIGNHSYSHPQFADLTRPEAEQEIIGADRAIRRATGAVPLPFFRFPYSATTPEGIAHANELGFADIEFTTDTNGYLGTAGGMTVQKVVDRVVNALTPGAIVQMHVGTAQGRGPALDVQALPQIIDAIHAHGYRITDLRTVLE